MNVPALTIKVSGNDGPVGTEWARDVLLHQPSLTLNEAPRLLADAEGVASLLLSVWIPLLRRFIQIGTERAASERHAEIAMEG